MEQWRPCFLKPLSLVSKSPTYPQSVPWRLAPDVGSANRLQVLSNARGSSITKLFPTRLKRPKLSTGLLSVTNLDLVCFLKVTMSVTMIMIMLVLLRARGNSLF